MVKYIVQTGDTLGTIAGKYGTTVQAIAKANGIRNLNMIHVGQILRIPTEHYHDNPHYSNGHYKSHNDYHHDHS